MEKLALKIVKRTLKDRYNYYKDDLLKEGTTLEVSLYGSFNNPRANLFNLDNSKSLEIFLPQGYLFSIDDESTWDVYDNDGENIEITLTKELIQESIN